MTKTHISAEPGVPFIDIDRSFEAPRELVFRAYSDPALLVQWLGPKNLTMTVEQFDLRDGGSWRYVHRDAVGNAYGFHGVFHGPQTIDGMLQTFEFDGAPGHVALDSAHASRSVTARPPCGPTPSTNPWRIGTPWSKAVWSTA